jgi:hypothetical protein
LSNSSMVTPGGWRMELYPETPRGQLKVGFGLFLNSPFFVSSVDLPLSLSAGWNYCIIQHFKTSLTQKSHCWVL